MQRETDRGYQVGPREGNTVMEDRKHGGSRRHFTVGGGKPGGIIWWEECQWDAHDLCDYRVLELDFMRYPREFTVSLQRGAKLIIYPQHSGVSRDLL